MRFYSLSSKPTSAFCISETAASASRRTETMELLLPLISNAEGKSNSESRLKAMAPTGNRDIVLWSLFAAMYFTIFLFNVQMTGFHFACGSIDVAEAATSLVFSASGLAVAIGLFLWNTFLPPTSRAWKLFALFGLASSGRAALLFFRHQWAFSYCFAVGSIACHLVAFVTWNTIA